MLLWVAVMVSIVIHHYLGRNWLESLVFRVSDGWCDDVKDGIGTHCFGDFGLGYFQGDFNRSFPIDYVPENFITTNTPLTIVMFQILGWFGYDTALGIYSSLMLLSIAFPLVHASRHLDVVHRTLIVVFGGILAHGTIATLDRGNHIGLLVTPAYLFILSLDRERGRATVGWLIVLSTLKFWGGLFFLPLLVNKRFRTVCAAGLLTCTGYLVPLAMLDGEFSEAFRTMLRVNSSNKIAVITAPYNISGNGLVQRIVCAARRAHWCNTTEPANQYAQKGLVSLVVLGLLVILTILILVGFKEFPIVRHGSLLAIPQFVIPDAAIYSTVFSTCLLAYMVHRSHENPLELKALAEKHRLLLRCLQLVLWGSLVPVAFSVTTLSWLGSSNGTANPEFKIQYWMNPILWSVYFVVAGVVALRILAENRLRKLTLQKELAVVSPSDSQD